MTTQIFTEKTQKRKNAKTQKRKNAKTQKRKNDNDVPQT
jgi:hypothetical protein